MYKCTECGSEYTEKPDFCDCGNDEFITVTEGGINNKTVEDMIANTETSIEEDKPKVQPAKPAGAQAVKPVYPKTDIPKRTFSEQYPMLSDFFKSLDPISTGIFFICLVLTFVVILYKPEIAENPITQKETVQVSKDIPHIDKFWNNTPPQVEKKVEEQEKQKTVLPEVQKIVQNITQPVVQQKTTPKTTTQKTTQTTKQQIQKSTQKQTTQKKTIQTQKTQAAKPVAQNKQQTQTTQKTQSVQQAQPVQTTQQTQPQVQPVQTTQTVKPSAEETAKKTAQAKQELANYKVALRNTIGRKIDFTKVIGDGVCIVSFKVNSSGKLTNRAFTQQSSNITLNDAVYAAVMATPIYNPPPSAYNNETLSLTIKFYNGNFEISIK